MASTKDSDHFLINVGEKYTVTQFQELAKTVSKTSQRMRKYDKYQYDKPKVSPRQEIYKSMLREIRNPDSSHTNMNSLVHKASGILRLEHYKNISKDQKVQVSWDMDGRRVLTYEGKGGISKTALERETNLEKCSKKKLLESLNEPIFGLDFQNFKQVSMDYDDPNNEYVDGSADCDRRGTPVSKLWEHYIDTGDVSKLWNSKEAIIPKSKRRGVSSRVAGKTSRASDSSSNSDPSSTMGPRPPWKSFVKPSRDRIKTWESTKTLWGSPRLVSSSTISSATQRERTTKGRRHSDTVFSPPINEPEEKIERVQHICVVNGSVVSFKDFAFENFTNWFGDDAALDANQRRCQPKFHLELDLKDIENKDVKIRYLDGYKLEIEAKRRIKGSKKPLRVKEYLNVPKGYRPEDLLLCRTKADKLVVEDLTQEPINLGSLSTTGTKASKSKINLKQRNTQATDRKRMRT